MKKNKYCFIVALFFCTFSSAQTGTNVVISQVYGGGGNTGAPYTNDYIELFNPTLLPIDLTGWSVQYASATGSSWGVTPLTGIIAAGSYFLIQQGGGASGLPLPTPDATDNTNMAATAGKTLLCNTASAFVGTCPTAVSIIDFVGYGSSANCYEGAGSAPAPSNTTAILRVDSGCTDANINATDFSAAAPAPRNSASPIHACGLTSVLENIAEPNSNVIVFPNPVKEKCTMYYNVQSTMCCVEVFDMLGNLVLIRKPISNIKQQLTLEVSNLISGIYFVRIVDGKNLLQSKFTKQ